MHASPRLTRAQYHALLDASVPDQLLHEVKGHVVRHSDLATRESRYQAAVVAIDWAKQRGYAEPFALMTLVARVLKRGAVDLESLASHPAVEAGLAGQALWAALIESEERALA